MSRQSGHTPGDWIVKSHSIGGDMLRIGPADVTSGRGAVVALATSQGDTPEARDLQNANACIVSAAPEMYAALRGAADAVCSLLCPSVYKAGETLRHSPACEAVSAAIDKAEGRE